VIDHSVVTNAVDEFAADAETGCEGCGLVAEILAAKISTRVYDANRIPINLWETMIWRY
jgi:hypothetical protein